MHIHRAPTSHMYQWNVIWCFPVDVPHCAEATIRKWFFVAIQNKNRKYCWNIHSNVSTMVFTLRWWIDRIAWSLWTFQKFGTEVYSRIIILHICWMLAVDGVCVCVRICVGAVMRTALYITFMFCILAFHSNALCFVYRRSTEHYTEAQRHMRARFFFIYFVRFAWPPIPMQQLTATVLSHLRAFIVTAKTFLLRAVSFSVAHIARMRAQWTFQCIEFYVQW